MPLNKDEPKPSQFINLDQKIVHFTFMLSNNTIDSSMTDRLFAVKIVTLYSPQRRQ